MKYNASVMVMAAMLAVLANGVSFGAEGDAAASVFFPETRYEFSPVLEDAKVVHDFVIQNKGNAPLQVQRVKTS